MSDRDGTAGRSTSRERARSMAVPRNVPSLIEWAERRLREAGVSLGHGTDDPRDEAAWLVLWAAGLPLDDPAAVGGLALPSGQVRRVRELVERRIRTRLPTAYLTGEAWFAGLRFHVDERVIVPRSHLGEWLAAGFAPFIVGDEVTAALDLCTGSGCIAVALAMAFPGAHVDAVDLSADALEVARLNVARYRLAGRVRLHQGDLFEPVAGRRYDLIVSNPPYVSARLMSALPPEHRYEPRMALDGGEDGLGTIRRIIEDAPRHLRPRGQLVLEAGSAAPAVQAAWPGIAFTWLASDSAEESPVALAGRDDLAAARRR